MKRVNARSRRGFVLLMVLAGIVVVGVAMTATARQSLQASLAAIEAQQSMQRRWGMISCQRTVLPAAAGLFAVSDLSTRKTRGKRTAFPSSMSGRVLLGGQVFDLVVADEDAKANLNAIYDASDRRACEQVLNQMVGAMESRTVQLLPARSSNAVHTAKRSMQSGASLADTSLAGASLADASPSGNALPSSSILPAFRSWGEVFDLLQVNRLAGDDRQLAKMTRHLALFGTGRLNVFRATDETVLAVCKSVVQDGLAKRVLDKIRETSLGEIDLILTQTVTNPDERKSLRALLGTSSSSYSLWIETMSRNARKQRYAVRYSDENGLVQTLEFSFE